MTTIANNRRAFDQVIDVIRNATPAEAASTLFLMGVFNVAHRDRQKNERYDACTISLSSLLDFDMHDSRVQKLLNAHGISEVYGGPYQIQTNSRELGRYHAVNRMTDFITDLRSEKVEIAA